MNIKQKLKDLIPGQIDDKIINQVVEDTKSVRDGATTAGLKAGNVLDQGVERLTNAAPGEMDDKVVEKIRGLLGGDSNNKLD